MRRHGATEEDRAWNDAYTLTRGQAKARGIEFKITRDEYVELSKLDCRYCGAPPVLKAPMGKQQRRVTSNGIDRVDNDIGYVYDNCVPCCEMCNRAKRNVQVAEFVAWIKRAAAHLA